jgi:hypothetical protein
MQTRKPDKLLLLPLLLDDAGDGIDNQLCVWLVLVNLLLPWS